jgi:hypothetical protein
MIGRPPAQLVAASASALREHAQRVELLERQLDDARAVLAEAAAVALDEGASLRAIGEVIGRRPSTVHALLNTHTKGDN